MSIDQQYSSPSHSKSLLYGNKQFDKAYSLQKRRLELTIMRDNLKNLHT
jgi:hypothetical protein